MMAQNADTDSIITFSGQTLFEILLIDHRWIIVCFILLPMSFVYNFWYYARNIIVFQLNTAPKSHDKKVQNIQRQVNVFIALISLLVIIILYVRCMNGSNLVVKLKCVQHGQDGRR